MQNTSRKLTKLPIRRQTSFAIARVGLLFGVSLCCLVKFATAQESDLDEKSFSPDKFTFVRIVYDSAGGPGEAWGP